MIFLILAMLAPFSPVVSYWISMTFEKLKEQDIPPLDTEELTSVHPLTYHKYYSV